MHFSLRTFIASTISVSGGKAPDDSTETTERGRGRRSVASSVFVGDNQTSLLVQ